jgi:hypothetical protein
LDISLFRRLDDCGSILVDKKRRGKRKAKKERRKREHLRQAHRGRWGDQRLTRRRRPAGQPGLWS